MENKKSIILISLIAFIIMLGGGTVAPLLASYAEGLGASGVWIGLLLGALYISRIFLGVPVGRMADRKGPKKMLIFSICIYPFVAALYWLSNNLVMLLCARLLQGVASVTMLPMAMTYMSAISPRGKEGQYLGFYNTMVYIGYGLGPILGGWMADQFSMKAAFIFLLVQALLALCIVFFLPETTLHLKREKDENPPGGETVNASKAEIEANRETQDGKAGLKKPWNSAGVMALAILNFVIAVLSMHNVSFFTIFIKGKEFGFLSVGFLIALNNLLIGVLQIPFGKVADKYNKYALILISTIVIIVALFIFPLAGSFTVFVILITCMGLANANLLAATSGLSAQLGKKWGLGTSMGFLGAANSLGMIIGPLLSGLVLDKFSIEYTFYFIGLLWTAGLISFLGFWFKEKSRDEKVVSVAAN
jgi:MFS transporter, DHA1 family, multidrug resistance protein